MSGADRKPWETATAITQSFLDDCADNLCCALEMVCEIELPGGGTIYASDRNKYVGSTFYEALIQFPTIERTIGEWLSNESEFSVVTLELSNIDGRFNDYIPGGASFGGWIGKAVIVKLGLRDVAATYRTLFRGTVTDIGGFGRSTRTIKLIARDDNDILNTSFPQIVFTKTDYPDIENDKEGLAIPFILGDWTTGLSAPASVPAFAVNGNDANVYGGTRQNVQCVISVNALSAFDTTNVYLRRSSTLYPFSSTDIKNVNADKNYFEIDQAGVTLIDGAPYVFDTGDEFFVRVQGPSLSGYRDNIVSQARHIIDTFVPGVVTFDSSWDTYRDKATPAQSAIASIKSRVWIQEPQAVLAYAKSLLQQVRLEAFFNVDMKLAVAANHFEDWDDSPAFVLKNWDIEKDSFQTAIDENNVFNRAQASYSFEPISEENVSLTRFYKNNSSITQLSKTISKQIVFPNLYVQADVEYQLIEVLRLASAVCENIKLTATWRTLLQDLSAFCALDVRIGPSMFSNVPSRIRSIGYESEGMKLNLSITCFQLFPFEAWNPGYAGIVSGQSATISQE